MRLGWRRSEYDGPWREEDMPSSWSAEQLEEMRTAIAAASKGTQLLVMSTLVDWDRHVATTERALAALAREPGDFVPMQLMLESMLEMLTAGRRIGELAVAADTAAEDRFERLATLLAERQDAERGVDPSARRR